MLWVKAFHIVFVIAWFAGLLYLPRLFVYHATTEDEAGRERFKVMERKLFGIMTVGGVGAAVFGGWLLGAYAWTAYGATTWWLPVKLALVGALAAFHVYCAVLVAAFARDDNRHGARFYRMINELPALLMVAVVVLVVVKPG